LYLETTIPSYLTARPSRDLVTLRRQRTTIEWWNSWRTSFDIYISQEVIEEAGAGNQEAARRRLQLLDHYRGMKMDDEYDDPIVAEIYQHRQAYLASLGHDMDLYYVDVERRAQALTEALAREKTDPNALTDLLSSKRWNGGMGPLGPLDN